MSGLGMATKAGPSMPHLMPYLSLQLRNIFLSPLDRHAVSWVVVLYGLACFSQPINVLWPLFAVVYLWTQGFLRRPWNSRVIGLAGCLAAIAFICIGLNLFYYSEIYPHFAGANKWLPTGSSGLGFSLLALGRYLFQLIFPLWPSISDHYPGSPQNLIGLLFYPVFAFWLWRARAKRVFPWALYFILPLLPLTVKLTQIFASDTYLVNAGAGFIIMMALLLHHQTGLRQKIWLVNAAKVAAVGLVMTFVISSRDLAHAWESELSLWERAYRIEATPLNMVSYAIELLKAGRPVEAFALALRAKAWDPSKRRLAYVLSRSIYDHPSMGSAEKVHLLEKYRMEAPWYGYYLSALYAKEGRFAEAFREISRFEGDPRRMVWDLREDLEIIWAERTYFCRKSGRTACPEDGAAFRPFLFNREWNSAVFERRLVELMR